MVAFLSFALGISNIPILVDECIESVHIEVFHLNDAHRWEPEEYNSTEDQLRIKTINEEISVGEIYDGVRMGV